MRNGKFKKYIFLLAMITVVNLIASRAVNAANGWEEDLRLVTPTTTSQVNSSVSLSLSSGTIQTDLDAANAAVNPDEAGKVLSQTATITVGNTDGYTVYVSGNTNLTGRNNTNHKIPSITSSKTLGSMSNEWGYYAILGDSEASYNPSTSFKAMTTSQQSVGTGGATSSSVTKKLTLFYGARVTSSAAEDFYGNTVTLSVVAQPRTVTTQITTMQDFAAGGYCSRLNTHDTLQLTDARDSKKYWVTKMLDGNCWMSQDLALDLSTNRTLDPATSDVSRYWTPKYSTIQNIPTGGSQDKTDTYSWNLGSYVIINPTSTTECTANATGLSACIDQFATVGSRMASNNPNFYRATDYKGLDGTTNCTKTANTTISTITSGTCAQYDAHYRVGNYYQWNTATAGTGELLVDGSTELYATDSICPKGWMMPKATPPSKGTFAYMLSQYGTESSAIGTANGYSYNIALSPMFFMRSGGIYNNHASNPLWDAGKGGGYLSSQSSSADSYSAYYFNFGSGFYAPSGNGTRSTGRSLRCLLPTS